MGRYSDKNPIIEGRYDAYGRRTYWDKGHRGAAFVDGELIPVEVAIIDEFDGSHGPWMASTKKYLAPECNLTKFDVEQKAIYAIEDCLEKCITSGINIVSISMSAPNPRTSLHRLIKKCRNEHNMLIFCSAGNTGKEYRDYVDIKRWPAAYDEVMSVLSTDNDFTFSDFASHGSTGDITGFGQNALVEDINGVEDLVSGTSPVTPAMAFTAALHWGMYLTKYKVHPTVDYMENFIISNTVDLGPVGRDNFFGYGFFTLDVKEFMRVKVMIFDYNKNGLEDRLDRMKALMLDGMSHDDAFVVVSAGYIVIGQEWIDGIMVPLFGGER